MPEPNPEVSKGELPHEKEKDEIKINWIMPDIQSEVDEIKRTAEEEGLSESEINDAISKGLLEELTEEIWSQLQNTESYDHVRYQQMEDVKMYAEKGEGRDWKSLLGAIKEGKPMKSPIVLIKPNGVPYLVSGNTRLMLSKVLGAKVKALIARMDQKEDK